jgi:biotin transport system substrate-specific component
MVLKTRDIVLTAMFAALICVLSPISVPIGPVPLSLASLAVYIAASVIGLKRGVVAVVVFIALGAVGVPVFSGFTGGAQKLIGPTGGYIIGYIPCAAVIGLFADRARGRVFVYPIGIAVGTALLYLCGTAWFVFSTGSAILYALGKCVVPFLAGDLAKAAAVTALTPAIRRAVGYAVK